MDKVRGVLLCSLWKRTSRNGNEYLSGRVNDGAQIVIFPQTKNPNPNAPNFNLYLIPIHLRGRKPKLPEPISALSAPDVCYPDPKED